MNDPELPNVFRRRPRPSPWKMIFYGVALFGAVAGVVIFFGFLAFVALKSDPLIGAIIVGLLAIGAGGKLLWEKRK